MTSNTDPSAPWFQEPDRNGPPGRWARYRAWIWTAAIVVVVMGLGVWNVVTNGPIHPHV